MSKWRFGSLILHSLIHFHRPLLVVSSLLLLVFFWKERGNSEHRVSGPNNLLNRHSNPAKLLFGREMVVKINILQRSWTKKYFGVSPISLCVAFFAIYL